jgi:predicted TIM-barrel fold metal-dependent hydrolase
LTQLIDTHAHCIPRALREALVEAGHERPDGFPHIPRWEPASALEQMDELGIDTAILSVSSPGIHLGGDAAARTLARTINEEVADLVRERPDRFGLFATLPLPDIDGSLAELVYAMDELGADGVGVLTNHNGLYLGDPRLEELFAELNRRRAVVFVHPTSPVDGEASALGYAKPMMEFIFDTTRAIVNLAVQGTLARCPGVTVLVSHAGAALPMLADRVDGFLEAVSDGAPPMVADALGRLWYDMAGVPLPRQLPALRGLVSVDQLTYGSDLPFMPVAMADQVRRRFDASNLLSDVERDAVYGNNALRLFPRLAR